MENRTLSPLEKHRLTYRPKRPQIFEDLTALVADPIETIPSNRDIQALFPKTSEQPIVRFKSGTFKSHSPLRVGVVLSGGQAAGGHNVISGLFDALKNLHPNARLFGFLSGPSGIIENRYIELNQELIADFRNTGGFDLIGAGRTKIETPEQLKQSLNHCKSLNLDGLVVVGGDDSNTNAAILAEYFLANECHTHVIGVPKTIDGDLKNAHIETSFGFDTACKIYSEMIGNICRDALSAKKYYHFIKLMGRSASHITLECALQTHPNLALLGEEIESKNLTLEEIVLLITDLIVERAQTGKNYGVILIPEGLIEFIPSIKILIQELNVLLPQGLDGILEKLSPQARQTYEYLPQAIEQQLMLKRDPHGNVKVSHIQTDQLLIYLVRAELKKREDYKGTFNPVGHFFGYEGRCGYPSNFDANYCYSLGFTAASLIRSGYTGYMGVVQKLTEPPEHWEAAGIPITMMLDFEKRRGQLKPVITKALVDLRCDPFRVFSEHREQWALEDCYRFPGPIQFEGPAHLCDALTFTLKLEQHLSVTV